MDSAVLVSVGGSSMKGTGSFGSFFTLDSRSWWVGYYMACGRLRCDAPPLGVQSIAFFSGVIDGRAHG